MNPTEVLRIVDAIHRDKNIEPEIVFEGIEAALVSAAKKHYGEECEIEVRIDREDGSITGTCDGEPLDAEETVGRIGAQTAKQVMIQKIREAERDALYDEYEELIGQMVTGVIQRYDGGAATVSLTNVEALLPRSEQIPGETHHANERVRTTVYEVRKAGTRVKIILSRTRPHLVQRLFEQEIPEIAEGVIEIKAIAREPGYRSKCAVISSDARVDCVGACVGVRGNRIKNIVDELAGERIDIVRWNDDLEELIPNALQPAEVEQVILCKMIGRAIVLVREDQLSLAIGRRGQNVRLASKLVGWDIEIMTQEELAESIDRAVAGFSELEGVETELAENLVEQGFLSYNDLEFIEPDALMEMGELSEEQVDAIVLQAEERAAEAERQAELARRQRREQERLEAEKARLEAETASEQAEGEEGAAEEGATEEGDEGSVESTEGAEEGDDASAESTEGAEEAAEIEAGETESAEAAETDGAETEGAETDGAETEGAETEPAEADAAESEPAEAEPAEAEATEAEEAGSETPQTESSEVEAEGETEGAESESTEDVAR